MPLTFPAHQGLILPVTRRWPDYFDPLALSIGAAMPDITDSILGFIFNGYFKQWYGHALIGVFLLDFPIGLLLTWLLTIIAERLLKSKLVAGREIMHNWQAKRSLWSFSVVVGTLSHLGFDLISHDENLLFFPWLENVRWFPEWWYTGWLKIRSLPIFGDSYSVGLFTVIWGVLSIVGTVLFFGFLRSKKSGFESPE